MIDFFFLVGLDFCFELFAGRPRFLVGTAAFVVVVLSFSSFVGVSFVACSAAAVCAIMAPGLMESKDVSTAPFVSVATAGATVAPPEGGIPSFGGEGGAAVAALVASMLAFASSIIGDCCCFVESRIGTGLLLIGTSSCDRRISLAVGLAPSMYSNASHNISNCLCSAVPVHDDDSSCKSSIYI